MPKWDDIQGAEITTTKGPRWDDIAGQEVDATGAPKMGAAKAATLGVAQGGTMGFVDELGGAVASFLPSALGGVPESSVKLGPAAMPSASDTDAEFQAKSNLIEGMANTPTSYELVRDRIRAEQKQAKEQQGAAYMAGDIVGGIAGSIAGNILLPGGGAIARGAAEGAIGGLGGSEADLLGGDIVGAAADTALGGAIGAGAGALGGAIASRLPGAAQATQRGLASGAQGRAVKAATGQNRRAISKMIEAGEIGLDTGTVERIGSDLLDEGVVSAGASARDIMKRAAERKEAWGQTIGETLDYMDELGASVNVASLADDLERELVQPGLKSTLGQRQIGERMAKEIGALREQGDEIGLAALEGFKRDLDGSINYAKATMDPASKALLRMRTMINLAIEKEADDVAAASGAPEVAKLFREAKAVWSSMNIGEEVAKKQVGAQASNRFIAPSDYAVGAARAVSAATNPVHAAVEGAAWALGHRAVRTRGNQVLAGALKGLSGNGLLKKVAEASPEMLGQFAGPITAAIARGADGDESALAAVDYVLQQTNPEYRAMKAELAKEAQ